MAKVIVNIKATQTVYYDQLVEMEEEKYEQLSNIHYSDDLAKELAEYIDLSDVLYADDLEDGVIELEE